MPLPHQVRVPPPSLEADFEGLACEAVSKILGQRLTLLGRRGQNQHGLDAFDPVGPSDVVCQFTLQQDGLQQKLEDDIAKMDREWPSAPGLFIFAVGVLRDEALQRFALELTSERRSRSKCPVEIIFWEKIAETIMGDADLRTKHYAWLAATEPGAGGSGGVERGEGGEGGAVAAGGGGGGAALGDGGDGGAGGAAGGGGGGGGSGGTTHGGGGGSGGRGVGGGGGGGGGAPLLPVLADTARRMGISLEQLLAQIPGLDPDVLLYGARGGRGGDAAGPDGGKGGAGGGGPRGGSGEAS